MLTVRYNLNNRFRPIEADPELLVPRSAPVQPIESVVDGKAGQRDPSADNDDQQLLKNIRQIEGENQFLHRENLFLAAYLRRIQTTTVLESLKDYRAIDDSTLEQLLVGIDGSRLVEGGRRSSFRKSSAQSSKGSLFRVQLSSSRGSRERSSSSPFFLLATQRFALAAYELEQTRLDWQRMTKNSNHELENLRLQSRMAASDASTQARLIHEVQRYVDRYRTAVGDEEFFSPRFTVPAELVVKRINKRITSRITVIGACRASTQRLRLQLQELNRRYNLENIDVILISTHRTSNAEEANRVNRLYLTERKVQHQSSRRVQELKQIIQETEQAWNETKRKIDVLQYIHEETQREIDRFEQENRSISEENDRLRTRLTQLWKIPRITEYAYVIKQTKFLEEQISIWTQRVEMVETFLSQLKQQEQSNSVLPALKKQ